VVENFVTPLLLPEVVETSVECTVSQTGDVVLDTLKKMCSDMKSSKGATRSSKCHFTEKCLY